MRRPRVAVVVFPGSNCEQDVVYALRNENADPDLVWHQDTDFGDAKAVILPGGFAHGDYLRTGAIARFSPAMQTVAELADRGRPILGICNGFQILTEAGLVPGALHRNEGLRFMCTWTEIIVEDAGTPWTCLADPGQILRLPINHYEGNYVPPREAWPRVCLRYKRNPNGSWESAAGIGDDRGHILGMMPHPERACEEWLGSTDGRFMFRSMVAWCHEEARV